MKKDPEMEQVKADRFYDLAHLMGIEIQPATAKRPEAIASQTVPNELPAAPAIAQNSQTVLQISAQPTSPLSGVDDPSLWIEEDDAARLQSLAQVQSHSFTPLPNQPQARGEKPHEPEPRKPRVKSLRRRWHEFSQQADNDERLLYAVVLIVGLLAHSTASAILPGWGVRFVEWGTGGVLLVSIFTSFLKREFYLSLVFALGIIIAKKFL